MENHGLLTAEENKHLDYLAQILNFGASELQTKIKTKATHSHLQNFLMYSFVPIHNYAEAIHVLCKDARPHASQSLLRSIFEGYMNIKYIKNSDVEKRLTLFAKDSFKNRKSLVNKLTAFKEKYPHLTTKSVLLEEANLKALAEFTNKHLEEIDAANNIESDEHYEDRLLQRVLQLDKEAPENEKGMYELNYYIMYGQLSLYTHLNSWGLEAFLKETPEGTIFSLGQEPEVNHIVVQTFLYYFDLLDDLYNDGVLSGEMPAKYREWANELKDETLK